MSLKRRFAVALRKEGGLISRMNTHGKRSGFLSARLSLELGTFAYLRAGSSRKDIQTVPPLSLIIFTTTTAATTTTTPPVPTRNILHIQFYRGEMAVVFQEGEIERLALCIHKTWLHVFYVR